MSNQDLLDPRNDPYAALGAKLDQSGLYLSFSKGEYLYGQNKDELKLGKRLVANIPGMRLGWRRWRDGKVTDDRTELLVDQRPVEPRDQLGDTDEGLWERDDRGQPRDPYVMTYTFELSDPELGELYSFSTTSAGGKKAVGKLLSEFSRHMRMHPNMLPIIELARESYLHSNKEYGKIHNPILKIVGWTDADNPSVDGDREAGEERDDDMPFDEPVKVAVPIGQRKPQF